MNPQNLKLVIDTNVWLDDFFGDRPFHKDARALIDLAISKQVQLFHAITTEKDVYYLSCATLKAKERVSSGCVSNESAHAIASISNALIGKLESLSTPIALDATDTWTARHLQSIHADFEDCLIMAAAVRANADFVVTNDRKLLQHCTVAALSCADMAAYLRRPER